MAPRPTKFSAIRELHYKYHILMKGFYNEIFIRQTEIYVTNNVKTESIEIQIIWGSVIKETLQTYTSHISISEDYNKLLQETYEMCKNIIRDAKPLGEAPYWEILREL